jgi:glycosyltransferase involved in cell wall biosynthesis
MMRALSARPIAVFVPTRTRTAPALLYALRVRESELPGASHTRALPDVLVVERRAHERLGHYPVLFAEVADGFAALGCRVTMLTARGWCLAGEWATERAVSQYGRVAALLDAFAERLRQTKLRWPRGLRRAGDLLQVAVLTRTAAAKARRVGRDTVVVVVTDLDSPALVAALAGRGRWLVYVYLSPRQPRTTTEARVARVVRDLARVTEWLRRRGGGCCVIAVQSDTLREQWSGEASSSGLGLVVTLLAGGQTSQSIPDARAQLGIDRSYNVALLFGSRYREKDPATVFAAFSQLDDWHLVVAGALAHDIPPTARVLQTYPGFVDERTRELLYSAADLTIVSFHPGFARNSGTLRDAIAWGIPVVCSDQPELAEVVTEYQLGTIFRSGDPDSLARAVRAAPCGINPVQLARARAERSNLVTAQHALDAVTFSEGRSLPDRSDNIWR